MKKTFPFWSWLWIVLGVLYFFIPLVATLDFSLRAKKGTLSLLAYQNILTDPQFVRTFLFSLTIGLLTIVVAFVLVFPTAFWIHLKLEKLRPLIEFITLLPFVIPAIVLVFGMIRVFSGAPFYLTNSMGGTYALLVAGYVVLALPYMYRSIDAGLRAMDVRRLSEAAQSLGAGWGDILIRVILPNLQSSALSGAFLTLAIVMGEFTIASFLVGINAFGPYMSLVGQNKAYESASLSVISFALTWLAMGALQLISARSRGGNGGNLPGGGH